MTKIDRTLCLIVSVALAFPAFALSKLTKTEDDGFSWVLVEENGFMGAESTSGKTIISLSSGFDWIKYKSGFLIADNLSKAVFDDNANITRTYTGVYTKNGECIISPNRFDAVFFNEAENGIPCYFDVAKEGKRGICDSTGSLIVQTVSYGSPLYSSEGFKIMNAEGNYTSTGITLPGHNPIAMAKKSEKSESDGFKWTELKSDKYKYGALDADGNLLLPIEFDRIKYTPSKTVGSTGLFVASKDDAEGWYAANGFAFVPIEEGFTYISSVGYGNYARVDKNDKEYGVYESTLGEIIPCGKYDYVSYDKDGFFRIEKNDKYGVVDMLGNEIVSPIYPFLSRDEKGISYTDDNGDDVYVYIGVFPETQERVTWRFENALKASDADDAITQYRNVILADPIGRYGYISNCYNNMGVAYQQKGDINSAIECFNKAVELNPNNTVAKQNIELINTATPTAEKQISGWDIASGILEAFSNAMNAYNSYTSNQAYTNTNDSQADSPVDRKTSASKRTKHKGNAFAKSVNYRIGNDTYNNYISQLIDMCTYPSRYNDAQRRSIQSSMKSIRERNGFKKSAWEDWDGNPNNAPR